MVGKEETADSQGKIRVDKDEASYKAASGQDIEKVASSKTTQAPRMQLEVNGRNITYFGETKHVEFQTRDMVDIRCQIPGGWDLVKTFAFMENFIKASKDF